MKRKNFVLLFAALFAGVLCFSGCSTQNNYEMSYEQVISLLENQSREMMGIFFNFGAQQKNLNLATKFDTDNINFDLDVQTQARVDYDSRVQDMSLSLLADVESPESEFKVDWVLDYSFIWDNMYFKLSKFLLDWSNTDDLAMVDMIANTFRWQRFSLNMSGFNFSKSFDLYDLYSEKMEEIVSNAWKTMINQWSWLYGWMFDEYKWYNAWKYSIDEDKVDEMLQMYVDMMNGFYSWMLAQYADSLWTTDEDMWSVDFGSLFSGITYSNLGGYFVIVWKNDVVETMEDAHITIDGTWVVFNYYYGKDWFYLEAKTESWEDIMLITAKRYGKTYSIYANMMSVLGVKWDLKLNKFSKKDWIDLDFDLRLTMDTNLQMLDDAESLDENNIEIPFKWSYNIKNINKFSLQEPSDAIDLMEMLWGYLWASMGGDDEYREDDEYEYWDDEEYEVADVEVEE